MKPRLVSKPEPKPLRYVDATVVATYYTRSMQQKWLDAVLWLRTRSRCGWACDPDSKAMFHATTE